MGFSDGVARMLKDRRWSVGIQIATGLDGPNPCVHEEDERLCVEAVVLLRAQNLRGQGFGDCRRGKGVRGTTSPKGSANQGAKDRWP